MRFEVGCDLEGSRDTTRLLMIFTTTTEHLGSLMSSLENSVLWRKKSSREIHLIYIVWRENDEIIGDAIWHETSTNEHRKGDPETKKTG